MPALPDDLPSESVTPCARCPEPSTGDVWGHPVCEACFGNWLDTAPNAGEAEQLATPEQLATSRAAGGLLSAFYEAWTVAWVKRAERAKVAA